MLDHLITVLCICYGRYCLLATLLLLFIGYFTAISIDRTFLSLRPPSQTRHWRYAIVDIVRRLLLTSMLLALGVFGLRIVYIWALMISFLFVTVTREQGQYWDASSDVLAYVLGQFVMVSPLEVLVSTLLELAPTTAPTLLPIP